MSSVRANESSADDILEVFRALLVFNSQLFRRLTGEEWGKSGVNFKGETVTLEQAVQAFINHVQTHLRQIERIKQALPQKESVK